MVLRHAAFAVLLMVLPVPTHHTGLAVPNHSACTPDRRRAIGCGHTTARASPVAHGAGGGCVRQVLASSATLTESQGLTPAMVEKLRARGFNIPAS